jgi:hypothetical protein
MGEHAKVIPLFKKRTCWECAHHQDVISDGGVSSRCGLFGEPIAWEGQADECDGYERGLGNAQG